MVNGVCNMPNHVTKILLHLAHVDHQAACVAGAYWHLGGKVTFGDLPQYTGSIDRVSAQGFDDATNDHDSCPDNEQQAAQQQGNHADARLAVERLGCIFPAFEDLALQCQSEEHTSELQSHSDIVCRLLL